MCSDLSDNSVFRIYKGPTYSKEGITINKHVLFETKTLGLSYHSVLFPNEDHIITDWMYFDVPKEIILIYVANFIFHTKKENNINIFILFNETSYSYKGISLAPIYGTINFEKNESSFDAIKRLLKQKLLIFNQTLDTNIFEDINKNGFYKLIYFNEFILDANRCRGDHHIYLLQQNITLKHKSQFNLLQSQNKQTGLHFIDCKQLHKLLLYSHDIILVKNSNALVWAWWNNCNENN